MFSYYNDKEIQNFAKNIIKNYKIFNDLLDLTFNELSNIIQDYTKDKYHYNNEFKNKFDKFEKIYNNYKKHKHKKYDYNEYDDDEYYNEYYNEYNDDFEYDSKYNNCQCKNHHLLFDEEFNETYDKYIIEIDLTDANIDDINDINIEASENKIIINDIKLENKKPTYYKYRNIYKVFEFTTPIDVNKVKANFKNNILTVIAPKINKTKKIDIDVE